jgi:hypothetical protein
MAKACLPVPLRVWEFSPQAPYYVRWLTSAYAIHVPLSWQLLLRGYPWFPWSILCSRLRRYPWFPWSILCSRRLCLDREESPKGGLSGIEVEQPWLIAPPMLAPPPDSSPPTSTHPSPEHPSLPSIVFALGLQGGMVRPAREFIGLCTRSYPGHRFTFTTSSGATISTRLATLHPLRSHATFLPFHSHATTFSPRLTTTFFSCAIVGRPPRSDG